MIFIVMILLISVLILFYFKLEYFKNIKTIVVKSKYNQIKKSINKYQNNLNILQEKLATTKQELVEIDYIEKQYNKNPDRGILPKEDILNHIDKAKNYFTSKKKTLESAINENKENMAKLYNVTTELEIINDIIISQNDIIKLYKSELKSTKTITKNVDDIKNVKFFIEDFIVDTNLQIDNIREEINDTINLFLEEGDIPLIENGIEQIKFKVNDLEERFNKLINGDQKYEPTN